MSATLLANVLALSSRLLCGAGGWRCTEATCLACLHIRCNMYQATSTCLHDC